MLLITAHDAAQAQMVSEDFMRCKAHPDGAKPLHVYAHGLTSVSSGRIPAGDKLCVQERHTEH